MRSTCLAVSFAISLGSGLGAQEVPNTAVGELLDAARGRLSISSNGWALVEVRHGTLSGDHPDTVEFPVTHDWNFVYTVCHNCTGIVSGVSMNLLNPSGTNVSNDYATLPREVVWAVAESIGTYRAVITGGGCGAGCRYTIGVFEERRGRRGEVWDDRGASERG